MKDIKRAKEWAEVYHQEEYKTAIQGSTSYLYMVIRRVNYLTTCLWLEFRNPLVEGDKRFITLGKKPKMIAMSRRFRRIDDERRKDLLTQTK